MNKTKCKEIQMNSSRLWRESLAPVLIPIVAIALTVGFLVTVLIGLGAPADTPQVKLAVVPKAADFDAQGPTGLAANVTAPTSVLKDQREQVDDGTYDTSGALLGATAQPARVTCWTPMRGAKRSISDIGLMVVHVTVSRNVPGLADINALCGFFTQVKASATWIVDNEGNSAQNVSLRYTPWTQAWFNRSSCSIEYVGSTGRPGDGAAEWTDRQLKEGGRLFAKCAKLAGIPIRLARVNGSTGKIHRTGVITHQALGAKGGNHTDPGPNFSMPRQVKWIKHFVVLAGKPTATDRVTCRKIRFWRSHGRKPGLARQRAVRRKAALTARNISCRSTGPVRVR